jgi:hypothetical protein
MINDMSKMEFTMTSNYEPLTTGFTPNYLNITVDTSKILPKPFTFVINSRDEVVFKLLFSFECCLLILTKINFMLTLLTLFTEINVSEILLIMMVKNHMPNIMHFFSVLGDFKLLLLNTPYFLFVD